jgi:DNA repair protein RecO (recombination protein O)
MSASKTLAFVLKKQDYRDTSLLADFYTRDWGRVRGVVKGVRDARARFGSTLEPFSLNEILFYRRKKGSDLHLVTQVDLIDLFPAVHEDLERLAAASYCVELVSELVESEESSLEIFELIHDTLRFLSTGASPKRAQRIFEVKLFDLLGLMPEVKACVFCRAEPQGAVYFNQTLGGIHCADCAQKQKKLLGGTSMPVSRGTLSFLDHVKRAPVTELVSVKVVHEVGAEVEKILRRFTDFHLSHKLKSLIFMEKVGLA